MDSFKFDDEVFDDEDLDNYFNDDDFSDEEDEIKHLEEEEVSTEDNTDTQTEDNTDTQTEDNTDTQTESVESIDTSEFQVTSNDNDFISDTGDFVVMDNTDSADNFTMIYIPIDQIAVPKRIRGSKNVESLMRSIKSTGLLNPIVVAPTITQDMYVLLHGYRRMIACARLGKKNIPCIVNNKVSTPEVPILEALYNHGKSYSIKEQVDYIEYLEKEKGILNPNMIEYLLQMNNGDYTKLKDILNDNDEDIVDKLFSGQYNIETAFKKLEQRRKKESAEEKELQRADKVYTDEEGSGAADIAGSGEEVGEDPELTEEELKNLAIGVDDLDSGLEEQSLEEMVEEGKEIKGFETHKQDPKNRERLDPALRKAVLDRDKCSCQICKSISGQEYREVLDVHHIIEVYLGGSDDISNLITACTVCHKLIHLYARGELYMRPYEEMTEEEREKFKRVVKLGNIIRKGMEAKGMKKEQLKKVDNAETIGRRLKGSSDQVAG